MNKWDTSQLSKFWTCILQLFSIRIYIFVFQYLINQYNNFQNTQLNISKDIPRSIFCSISSLQTLTANPSSNIPDSQAISYALHQATYTSHSRNHPKTIDSTLATNPKQHLKNQDFISPRTTIPPKQNLHSKFLKTSIFSPATEIQATYQIESETILHHRHPNYQTLRFSNISPPLKLQTKHKIESNPPEEREIVHALH